MVFSPRIAWCFSCLIKMMILIAFLLWIHRSNKISNIYFIYAGAFGKRRILLGEFAVENDDLHQRGRESIYFGRQPVH